MNLKTFNKYYTKLSKEVSAHPNKEELLNIMSQQLWEDNPVIAQELIPIKAA